MKPIKNEPGLMRDEKTGVIINTNDSEYQLILQQRQHESEIDKMNREVEELKQLVKAMLK